MNAGLGTAPSKTVAIKAGIPFTVHTYMVNKVCGSSMMATILCMKEIMHGYRNCTMICGTESMTNAPIVIPNMRLGAKFGCTQTYDVLEKDGLYESLEGVIVGKKVE